MKVNKILIIIIALIMAASVVFWLEKVMIQETVSENREKAETGESALIYKSIDQLTEKEVKEIEQPEVANYKTNQTLEKYESTHGFYFLHSGFRASAVPNDSGELLTFDRGPVSFQIFIISFDESGPITPERIKRDLSDIEMADVRYAILDGIDAIFFYGNAEGLDTYEVWAINNNRLYQIMTYRGMEEFLNEVMNTWKWS